MAAKKCNFAKAQASLMKAMWDFEKSIASLVTSKPAKKAKKRA